MRILISLTLGIFLVLQYSCGNIRNESEEIKEVKIGAQIWMAENLDTEKFQNGDLIREAKTNEEWEAFGQAGEPAWCYNTKSINGEVNDGKKYGKLYNFFAVNDPRGLAPNGWHVPSDEEWTVLTDFLGGSEKAGPKIKFDSSWYKDQNGSNISGFSGLPGGLRKNDGSFSPIGFCGSWWSSTDVGGAALSMYLQYDVTSSIRSQNYWEYGFSVRCVKDDNDVSTIKREKLNYENSESIDAKIITIGAQEWMSNNLNVDKFRNGDLIYEAKSEEEWEKAESDKIPAWCYYENNPKNGTKYGKLYNWYAVKDRRGLAPEGWHIPSEQEWAELDSFVLNLSKSITDPIGFRGKNPGFFLKGRGWRPALLNGQQYFPDGNDVLGFSALPGGYRDISLKDKSKKNIKMPGTFDNIGYFGTWWTSTESSSSKPIFWVMSYENEYTYSGNAEKGFGFSVRCLKD